jgi:nucleotide-binding universal stress UspA family protein
MFKHILLPTDGSGLSEAAIQKGIQLAKSIIQTEMLEDTKKQYESESKVHAEQFLGVIKKAAEKAGVRCDTDYVTSNHPYEMIIQAAEKKGCDLIMMASHGRRGVQGLLIGSETQKVLTHSKIPVLVFR